MVSIKKPKWRGINTTQKRKNEQKPVTITNRLGQKSLSLPRIDDDKRWSGYPSLAGAAKIIAKVIPDCNIFVEPFCGTGKVFQELIKMKDKKIKKYVLNDTSDFIIKWLKANFSEIQISDKIIKPVITNIDFTRCVKKYDSTKTVFLFDMPWNKRYYQQSFSSFNRETVKQYCIEVLDLCRKLKGKFIITTRIENRYMLDSEFDHRIIKSIYVLSGHYPKILLTNNMGLK